MPRSLIAVVGLLLLPVPASAAVYEGHFKGVPGSTVEFRVEKSQGGKRDVTEGEWTLVPYTCDDVETTLSGSSGFATGTRVKDGKFDVRFGGGFSQNRLKGRLKPGGKASGIFRSSTSFMISCDTGVQEWVAERD